MLKKILIGIGVFWFAATVVAIIWDASRSTPAAVPQAMAPMPAASAPSSAPTCDRAVAGTEWAEYQAKRVDDLARIQTAITKMTGGSDAGNLIEMKAFMETGYKALLRVQIRVPADCLAQHRKISMAVQDFEPILQSVADWVSAAGQLLITDNHAAYGALAEQKFAETKYRYQMVEHELELTTRKPKLPAHMTK